MTTVILFCMETYTKQNSLFSTCDKAHSNMIPGKPRGPAGPTRPAGPTTSGRSRIFLYFDSNLEYFDSSSLK